MMESLYRFLKMTVVGGLLVLVPVAVCIYTIAAVVKVLLTGLAPVAKFLHVQSLGGIVAVELVAVLMVVAVCFLFGLLVQTAGGRAIGTWFEKRLFNLVPGYQMIKKISRQFSGGGEETLGTPVVVKLGDSRQIGFLVEQHPSGEVAVFIPFAPAVSLGSVHIIPAEHVERLNATLSQVVDCITKVGFGSAKVFSVPKRPEDIAEDYLLKE
jgi:uncharacterized membrane protein